MNINQLQAAAARQGAEVDLSEDSGDAYAYSPKGQVWNSTGTSVLTVAYMNIVTRQTWRAKAFAELADLMAAGSSQAPADYTDGWWEDDD